MMINKPVALVTGASSGIGEAIAHKLVAAGYSVYGTSRRGGRGKRGGHCWCLMSPTMPASKLSSRSC
jgi:NAD(P)-dependent dehydrogenase (short-subunit alcohol dehydrogenase family)